jgi:hypothetical protein
MAKATQAAAEKADEAARSIPGYNRVHALYHQKSNPKEGVYHRKNLTKQV